MNDRNEAGRAAPIRWAVGWGVVITLLGLLFAIVLRADSSEYWAIVAGATLLVGSCVQAWLASSAWNKERKCKPGGFTNHQHQDYVFLGWVLVIFAAVATLIAGLFATAN